jgi:MFS family permease
MNLAATIGPAIGGFLASRSYLSLFITDAILSVITAGIVFTRIPETRPDRPAASQEENLLDTLRGYRIVLRDGIFLVFLLASMLMTSVYMQMNSTLPVYLRDVHGLPEQNYGYLLSLNAAMVVLFQFWISRRIPKKIPFIVLAVGTVFYAIGFAMYGFVTTFLLFIVAMVIITIGEMLVAPVGQALVAKFSPADMRGRYMAVFGFSWAIPSAVAPMFAGIIMDNFNPDWVWYTAGVVGLLAMMGFLYLNLRVGKQDRFVTKMAGEATS